MSPQASRSISRSCRPCTTCWRRACRARRFCTSTGATTPFSRLSSTSISRPRFDAPIKVTREISTARQCMAPIEGRGTVAYWDSRMDQLVLYTGSQMPHIVRTGLAECLGLMQTQVRIVSPDVGRRLRLQGHSSAGGRLPRLARDALRPSGALARGPARASDRRRQLPGASLSHHRLRRPRRQRCAASTVRRRSIRAPIPSYPFSACLEAAQVASILPGPYDFQSYRCRTWSVATNKCPILPYRGVARTGVCLRARTHARSRRAGGRARAASRCA